MIQFKSVYCMSVVYWLNDVRGWNSYLRCGLYVEVWVTWPTNLIRSGYHLRMVNLLVIHYLLVYIVSSTYRDHFRNPPTAPKVGRAYINHLFCLSLVVVFLPTSFSPTRLTSWEHATGESQGETRMKTRRKPEWKQDENHNENKVKPRMKKMYLIVRGSSGAQWRLHGASFVA
jgi:hypothetical protein